MQLSGPLAQRLQVTQKTDPALTAMRTSVRSTLNKFHCAMAMITLQ